MVNRDETTSIYDNLNIDLNKADNEENELDTQALSTSTRSKSERYYKDLSRTRVHNQHHQLAQIYRKIARVKTPGASNKRLNDQKT